MRNLLNADVGKVSKTVQHDLIFIFNELSELVVILVSNLIFSAVKMLVSYKMSFMGNEVA